MLQELDLQTVFVINVVLVKPSNNLKKYWGEPMEIRISKQNSATVVAVTGRMDAITTPEYEKRLNEQISAGETVFVCDLEGLDYISSAGLRGILTVAKQLKTKGGQMRFANMGGAVKEVFDISGFGSIFQLHDSVAEALSGLE